MKLINKVKNYLKYRAFRRIQFAQRGIDCALGERVVFSHPEHIILGNGISFGDNCIIQTWPEYQGVKHDSFPELIIHDHVSMMSNCHISCMNRIEIGQGCLFGDNVFVTDNYHGKIELEELEIAPIERRLYSKGPVIIGKNVWLGRNVCVMPGVIIGNGAIVGANSVVTKDVAANTVVAGCPAKSINNFMPEGGNKAYEDEKS